MPESIVERKPRPRNRVFLKLSGGRFFTVAEAETAGLRVGSILSAEHIERLSRMDQYFRGHDKALRLLAIRSRTQREIHQALDALGLEPAIRDGVIGELKERGLVDDERFAREFVRVKTEFKHLGPHRLRFELNKHGIKESTIEKVFADEITGDTQEALARDLVARKIGSRTPDEKDIRRLGGLLRRKGIDYAVINHVLYDLLQRARSEATFQELEENEQGPEA